MKRKSKLRRLVYGFLGAMIIALLGMNVIRNSAFYESADRNFFGFISMLKYGLIDKPIDTVSGFTRDVATMWDVRYENDMLRRQLEAATHWETRVKALEEEVQNLKGQNGLDTLYTDLTMINSTMKSRSSEKWDQAITIDRGSSQGVAIGDGVIAAQGIIGRVISVSETQSVIALLTANDDYSQASVRIEITAGQYVQGILESYDHEKGLFAVSLLDANTTVTKDMVVSTAGIGGVYPTGLFVGKVDSVKNIADGMGVRVYVKSGVNFNDLRYVSVVKRS